MGELLRQFMNKYPYTDFHELNADWLIKTLMEMINQVENFVSLNAIKYADPIQWDIVRQYEKNTVVIDPLTGTAYISVQPVPSGVALNRTEYWTVVFDLGSFVTRAAKNFSNRYEADTTLTATFSTTAGNWLVWGDTLYEALVNITAGDQYVVDSNIRHITMEEVADALAQAINTVDTKVGDLSDLTTTDKTSIVNAINSVLDDLNITVGDLAQLLTSDNTSIVNAINSEVTDRQNAIDELTDELINVSQFKRFGYFWETYDNHDCYPQGFCIINDTYVVTYFQNNTTGDCVLRKSRLSDGFVEVENTFNMVCHGNTLTYIPEANEIWAVNYYATLGAGVSNIISIFDADTLTFKNTITLAGISSISSANYRDGKLFVATRDNQPKFYLYDLSGNQDSYLFTCPYPIMWLSYLKSNNKIIASNGFNMAYEFSIDGEILGAYQIPEISEDRSNYLAELEGFDELNGVLIVSDVGYKRINDKLLRRHILNTVGVNLTYAPDQDFHPLRLRSDSVMHCSNTYHTYQSGTSTNPFDSVEYAATLGGFIHTRPDIYGNNETFNECVVMRDCGTVRIRNCTIGGLVVEDTVLNAAGNFIVNTSCKDMVATYTGSSFGGLLYINRHSMVEFLSNSNYIDCENDNSIQYAVWKGPDCNYLGVGSTIRNMDSNTLPIVSYWSESTMFGSYFSDSNNDNPYDTLHRNQNAYDSKLRNRFGGIYGAQEIDLSASPVTLDGTVHTFTFKGKNFVGHMMTLNLWDMNYVFDITDLTGGSRFDITITVGNYLKQYRVQYSLSNNATGAVLTLKCIQELDYLVNGASSARTVITDATAGSDLLLRHIYLW